MENKHKIIASPALLIMFLTFIGYVIGFAFQMIIAYHFGANRELDAFYIASIIPNFVYDLFYGIFVTVFIIVFSDFLDKEKDQNMNAVFSSYLSLVIVLLLLIILPLFIFSRYFASLVGPGFNEETIIFAANILKILLLSTFFLGVTTFTSGILYVKKNFLAPSLVRISIGICIIISLLIAGDLLGVYVLAIGTVVGSFLIMIIHLYAVKKEGISLALSFNWNNEYVKKVLTLSLPLIIYTAFFYLNRSLNSILASYLPMGSVASLNYGFVIISSPIILFSGSIGLVLFPLLREKIVLNKIDEFKKLLKYSLSVIIYILTPISIFFILFAEEIIHVFFERGEFSSGLTSSVGEVLLFYSIGIIALGVHTIILKTLYSLKKIKTQVLLMAILFCINITLSLLFMGNMGISGLALAFSLAHWIIICMGLFLIRENLGKPEIGMIAEAFLKAMLGSVIAGSLSLMVYYVMIMAGNLFLESRIAISVSFFLVSFVYVGVYIIVSKLLKNNELYVIMTNLKKITHDKMKIQL